MVKEQFQETDVAKISDLTFSFMSADEMRRVAHLEVTKIRQYEDGKPSPYGVMDTRMGLNLKIGECGTCGKPGKDCVGHYGFIDLALPCFHIGYLPQVMRILQSICKSCSAILLPEDKRQGFLDTLKKPGMGFLQKKSLCKKIKEECRKVGECPKCGASNGTVKKCGFSKLLHDKHKKKGNELIAEMEEEFSVALQNNRELKPLLSRYHEVLDPIKVRDLFKLIKPEDVKLLLMNPSMNGPEDLILTRVLVPPPCIRPSVKNDMTNTSNEDDITVALTHIIQINEAIRKQTGGSVKNLMVAWDGLQLQVCRIINGDILGPPSNQRPQSMRGFIQRLKGKKGRFRGNLSGKRVNFSARTVISPDPTLQIDQVAVPLHIAKILSYPEKVTSWNIEMMRQVVRNGPHSHPGAEILVQNGEKKYLRYGNLEAVASSLVPGDTVIRHLKDGDVVLFNRQPSLHKLSIMAFYAKVMPHKTFRMNLCCCAPFNADFDGDEMNLHLPQTEEAKAEALVLMGSKSNMVTPRSGEPLIAATQDFITASYLLTQKDTFFPRAHAIQLVAAFQTGRDEMLKVELPPPAIWKPMQLWTGKQLFGLILRPNKSCPVKVNLQTHSKSYSKKFNPILREKYGQTEVLDLCPKDGYVCIQNSELMCGVMDKVTLGSGSKNNIFYVTLCYFGEQYAADSLARLSKLCPFFLTNAGFSIGLGDVTPSENLLRAKEELLDEGLKKCEHLIQEFHNHTLAIQPGMTEEQTLEALILKELSTIRDRAGQICLDELPRNNSPLIMALCGSKGSNINISQMIAVVGQQAISGARVPNGFEDRALPHFSRGSRDANARGFVQNSFFSGLTPSEFFFHTMAGREGLVDTAVKTADTGYMQRRLIKSLEDLCVQYDKTVRTSSGEVIQFMYGGDNLNPAAMECDNKPINFERLWDHVKMSTVSDFRHEPSMSGRQLEALVEDVFLEQKWAERQDEVYEHFKGDIREHIRKAAQRITEGRASYLREGISTASVVYQVERVTKSQVLSFLDTCYDKYNKAAIEPGEAIGAITAQSVGEPGTQMTLKTFHFAGVASMNITLGVPRVMEIINATESMKSPIIEAKLDVDDSKEFAEVVKSRVDKTTLGEVSKAIKMVYLSDNMYIIVSIDFERIKLLKLEIDLYSMRESILGSKLKLHPADIEVREDLGLIIKVCARTPGKKTNEEITAASPCRMMHLAKHLQEIVIAGVRGVKKAVVFVDEKNSTAEKTKYKLYVQGTNLAGVMGIQGVNGKETTSNNIMEVYRTLGIEAARTTIINELKNVMESHGMTIDIRHIMMMADIMTSKGEVFGTTRHGLAKMKESTLRLASFEQTADHLFEAAYFGQKDNISGVSESIIMGTPMTLGTGLFRLLQQPENPPRYLKRDLLFDRPDFHLPEYRDRV